MRWAPLERKPDEDDDWRVDAGRRIDPYLVWAELTGFRGVRSDSGPPGAGPLLLRVALELEPNAPRQLGGVSWIECARAAGSIFATASVMQDDLPALLQHAGVRRLELGFTGAARTARATRQATKAVAQPVVAVIDFGCAFAHERFRCRSGGLQTSWKTRIRYLWDQGATPAPPWCGVAPFGYGRELTGAAIDALMAEHSSNGRVDEDAVYAAAAFGSAAVSLTHGTHVLDLAAGAPANQPVKQQPAIIFVQLPAYAVDDTSGGSMVTHVLDALRYILDRTAPQAPLAINLSYGSMAGPHDGSTLLESAMDAVIQGAASAGRPLTIVLPAGNSFEADGHARFELDGAHREQTLLWQVQANDATDSFVEVWYPCRDDVRLVVTVTPPNGAPVSVGIDDIALLQRAGGPSPIGAVIHRRRVAGGLNDAMALIALAPTYCRDDPMAVAPAGVWRVAVALEPGFAPRAGVEVHAWIERDDPGIGSGAAPRQSRFITGSAPLPPNEYGPGGSLVVRTGTGSSIANGALTLVVGACVARDSKPARYTAAGPTRNAGRPRWPDLAAPSDDSAALSGVLAAGTRSGVVVRMNGTSVAAPQVARRWIGQFLGGPGLPPLGAAPDQRLGVGPLKP